MTDALLPEIPDKTYFKIGEVADIVGVKPYILRYWETEFPYLSPKKTKARHRMYRRHDIEVLLQIKALLYDQMYTIAGARKRLKEMVREGSLEILGDVAETGGMADALNGAEHEVVEQELGQLRAQVEQLKRERDEAEQTARLATEALRDVEAAHEETLAELEEARKSAEASSRDDGQRRVLELEQTVNQLRNELGRVRADKDKLARHSPHDDSDVVVLKAGGRDVLEAVRSEVQGILDLIEPMRDRL